MNIIGSHENSVREGEGDTYFISQSLSLLNIVIFSKLSALHTPSGSLYYPLFGHSLSLLTGPFSLIQIWFSSEPQISYYSYIEQTPHSLLLRRQSFPAQCAFYFGLEIFLLNKSNASPEKDFVLFLYLITVSSITYKITYSVLKIL